MDYRDYIVSTPNVCGGKPVVKGTRVTVRTVLDSLAEGASVEDILADFPTLPEEAVRAIKTHADSQPENRPPT